MPQLTIDQALQLALQHHRAGRLSDAEALYRQILAQQPDQPDATYLLGVLLGQLGRYELAVDLIEKVIKLHPDNPELHANRGEFLRHWGKLPEALASLQHVLKLSPNSAPAHHALGIALFDSALLDQAVAAFQHALAIDPNYAEAHFNLGNAFYRQRRLQDAVAQFQAALRLNPRYAEAHSNLALALFDLGHAREAIAAVHQAIQINPNFPDARNNLGNILQAVGDLVPAIAAYREALRLNPDHPGALINLGNALQKNAQFDEALAVLQRALKHNPASPEAHCNLGAVHRQLGHIDDALALYQNAMALDPQSATCFSNYLFTLHCRIQENPAEILQKSLEWDHRLAATLAPHWHIHAHDRNPDRRLRIAYVSPDFRHHSVAYFLIPLLESRNREHFHVTCYTSDLMADPVTARIQKNADSFSSIAGLSDEHAAQRILQDRIDILVDLAGHTSGNRLLLFAHKPAPLQITYLGYPGTTGLGAIDYRLSDAFADPLGQTDAHFSEQIIRLPHCAWCFTPLSGSPAITELPALQRRHVTFGSFNNFAKINTRVLDLWAQLLQRLPTSRLVLKNAAMASLAVVERLRRHFTDRSISASRLDFLPLQNSSLDHLRSYDGIDIALDTFPYHGTTTTCESLWMGVPVITLAGQSHLSRVGVSLLSNVGLPNLVAHNAQEYIDLAARLAENLPALTKCRTGLRAQMQASPLMNANQFAADVENAYRHAWHKWCADKAKT